MFVSRVAARGRAEASILHADLDSFYASVEQRDQPSLRGRPVIVGGGVVLAASYEAKAFGVRTPMGVRDAMALCPGAIMVPPRFEAYTAASRAVFEIFEDTTPVVEPISVDEAFLDVGGLRRLVGSPKDIAARLRNRVRTDVGLPISVGIAPTKFLAKVASAASKPDGLLEVAPGTELDFLHPLPIEALWGVGAVTSKVLRDAGIGTVGDMATAGEKYLCSLVGRAHGRHLYALSLAHDPRQVQTGRRRRSIGAQRALGRRARSLDDLDAALTGLVERVTRRLRAADRVCRTVVVRMRFDDFTRATRSRTRAEPTDSTDAVLAMVRGLLDAATPMLADRGCSLIGVALTNLEPADSVQLALPFADVPGERPHPDQRHSDRRRSQPPDDPLPRARPPRTEHLDETVDELRDRFGSTAIRRARLLHRDDGLQVPMLPD